MKNVLLIILLPICLMFLSNTEKKEAMKLGQLSQIAATTKDLSGSIAYWKKLGFRVVFQDKTPYPWAQLTDESILIYLIEDPKPFQRLSYFTNDYEGTLKNLKKAKVEFKAQDNNAAGKPWRTIFDSPDGMEISVVNVNPSMMYHPTAKTMLTMDQNDMGNPDKMPTKLGMFGEYCHMVKDLKVSVAYWEKLGFKSTGLNDAPYPWAIMSDGLSLVGLHQTTDWEGSAITYFAPDMGKRLEDLKAKGIEGKEFGMGPSNVIVTTPEGIQLFLFSL